MIRSIPGIGPEPIPIIPPDYRPPIRADNSVLCARMHALLVACRFVVNLRLEEQNGTGFVDYCGILRRIRSRAGVDCDANKTEV